MKINWKKRKMNSNEFLATLVFEKYTDGRQVRVLDYGCGYGQLVGLLRDRGIDAWGCDIFYGGGDRSTQIPAEIQPIFPG